MFSVVKHPAGNSLVPFRAIEFETGKEVDVIRVTLGSRHMLIPPAAGRSVVVAQEINVPAQGLRITTAKNFLGTRIPTGTSFLVFEIGMERFLEKCDGDGAFSLKYTKVETKESSCALPV